MTDLPTFKLGRRTIVLGRHVNHDPRSRDFPADTATGDGLVLHTHHATTLNQGQLGSCTGNAMAQALGTEPLWHKGVTTTEKKAQDIYSLGTKLDDIPGQWPPTDTGCSGLGVGKAARTLKYISSYTHAFGIAHALGAIQIRPFITGTNWHQDMFTPDREGYVRPTGAVAGGHEYEGFGYLPAEDAFLFLNSWGPSFGIPVPEAKVKGGAFKMTRADFATLLAAQGDITVPVV